MRIIKPNAKEVDQERYLRKPAYLESDTIEIDLDDLYNRYEDYKIKIRTEPIDSDYEPIKFTQFAEHYISKKEKK